MGSQIAQTYLLKMRYKLMEEGWTFDWLRGWINKKHPTISIVVNEESLTVFREKEFADLEEVNNFLTAEKI